MLVVIAILGLLPPAAFRQLGSPRNSVARQSIERLGSVLDLYRLDVGAYPSSEQGLAALNDPPADAPNWHGLYLKGQGDPLDPWSHPSNYRNPSTRAGPATITTCVRSDHRLTQAAIA